MTKEDSGEWENSRNEYKKEFESLMMLQKHKSSELLTRSLKAKNIV